MDNSIHCALSGKGAREFALDLSKKVPKILDGNICEPEDLVGDDCPNQIRGIEHGKFEELADYNFGRKIAREQPLKSEKQDQQVQAGRDSVGAVAIDRNGYLACAISAGTYACAKFLKSRPLK